jgi:hypothetical protein
MARRSNAIPYASPRPCQPPFDGQAASVHRVGRERQIRRPRIEWRGEAQRRPPQRRHVRPVGERVRRVVARLSAAAARRNQSPRLDDRKLAIDRGEDRGDVPRVLPAGIVVVRPNQHAPARNRRPVRLARRPSAAARCRGDGLREDARRRVRRLFALANDHWRVRVRRDPIGVVERAPVRPMGESPALAVEP